MISLVELFTCIVVKNKFLESTFIHIQILKQKKTTSIAPCTVPYPIVLVLSPQNCTVHIPFTTWIKHKIKLAVCEQTGHIKSQLRDTYFYIYKVVISVCLGVCLSDHNSGTHGPFCLKILIGKLGRTTEMFLAWF